MSQTKRLGQNGIEVTIDAAGHCDLPEDMTSVPRYAFLDWDGIGDLQTHSPPTEREQALGEPSAIATVPLVRPARATGEVGF